METNIHCELCEKNFQRKTNLANHMKTVHNEEVIKFICSLFPICKGQRCDGFFYPIGNLKVHYTKTHKEEQLKLSEVKSVIVNKKCMYV